jgi:hypothetical protein
VAFSQDSATAWTVTLGHKARATAGYIDRLEKLFPELDFRSAGGYGFNWAR